MKNGVFYFGISSPISEILKFLFKNWWSHKLYTTVMNSKFEYLQKYWMDVVQNLAPVMYIR